jgi:WhiB family redox-sensing transcriptional regulator
MRDLVLLGSVGDEQLSWQERSLCAQTDPEAFFPEKGGSTREAKKVCVGCEVRAECLSTRWPTTSASAFGVACRSASAAS